MPTIKKGKRVNSFIFCVISGCCSDPACSSLTCSRTHNGVLASRETKSCCRCVQHIIHSTMSIINPMSQLLSSPPFYKGWNWVPRKLKRLAESHGYYRVETRCKLRPEFLCLICTTCQPTHRSTHMELV